VSRWRKAKDKRAIQIGGYLCEVCGLQLTRRDIVGHHKRFRCYGGEDTVENCMLKCQRCEQLFDHVPQNSEGFEGDHNARRRDRRNTVDIPCQQPYVSSMQIGCPC